MLVSFFSHILKMSLTGGLVIVLICALRLLLRRAPKIISYVLWSVAALRLVFPVGLAAPVSLVPGELSSGKLVSQWSQGYVGDIEIHHDQSDRYQQAVEAGRQPVFDGSGYYVVTRSNQLDAPWTVEQTVLPIVSGVWLCGVLVMLSLCAVSYRRLRRRLVGAVHETKNIYLADHIDSPFVMGILRPRIYLPSDLPSAQRGYIVVHERHHLKRLDHLVKLLAYLILCVHWFNPLVWLAYFLLCQDMEMSCDEAVIRQMGGDIRAEYCTSLLGLASGRRFSAGMPLMFGEADAKRRIKNLAVWRRPSLAALVLSACVCILAAGCLLTDPKEDETPPPAAPPQDTALPQAQPEQTPTDPNWPFPPVDRTKPLVYDEAALRYWDYFAGEGQPVSVLEMDGNVLSDESIAVYSYLSAFYHTPGADHAKGLPIERLKEESLRYFGRIPATYVNARLEIDPVSGAIIPTGWDGASMLYLLEERQELPDGRVRAIFSLYPAYDGSSDWPISAQDYEYALLSGQLHCLPELVPISVEMVLTEKTAEDGSFFVQYHSVQDLPASSSWTGEGS